MDGKSNISLWLLWDPFTCVELRVGDSDLVCASSDWGAGGAAKCAFVFNSGLVEGHCIH